MAVTSGLHGRLYWTVCNDVQVKLQGIPGIRKVFMRELKTTHLDDSGIYQTENQWVLDTEGVNLLDVRPYLAGSELCSCHCTAAFHRTHILFLHVWLFAMSVDKTMCDTDVNLDLLHNSAACRRSLCFLTLLSCATSFYRPAATCVNTALYEIHFVSQLRYCCFGAGYVHARHRLHQDNQQPHH